MAARGTEGNRSMRSITVTMWVSLDGVVQGLGRADEDTRGGFTHGGWGPRYDDEVMGREMAKAMTRPGDMLLGRAAVRGPRPADRVRAHQQRHDHQGRDHRAVHPPVRQHHLGWAFVLLRQARKAISLRGPRPTWWVHHWFPETARTVDTWPTVEQTCQAFAAAGFSRDSLEQIPETYRTSLAEFLAQADTFRRADSTMRTLTEEEFLGGKERLRRAAQDAEKTPSPEPRTSRLDLLVLR